MCLKFLPLHGLSVHLYTCVWLWSVAVVMLGLTREQQGRKVAARVVVPAAVARASSKKREEEEEPVSEVATLQLEGPDVGILPVQFDFDEVHFAQSATDLWDSSHSIAHCVQAPLRKCNGCLLLFGHCSKSTSAFLVGVFCFGAPARTRTHAHSFSLFAALSLSLCCFLSLSLSLPRPLFNFQCGFVLVVVA